MADAELSVVAHGVNGHHGRKGGRIGDADGMLRGARIDVPAVPTLPFDHGCSAIHFSRSAPSGPSS